MVIASIKKGFTITGKSMGLLAVLFVFGLIWNLINLFYVQDINQAAEPSVQQSVLILALGLVFILISILIQGGSMGYVLQSIKQGKSSLSEFVNTGKKFYGKMFLLGFLVSLILIVLFVAIVLVATLLMEKVLPLAVTITAFLGTAVVCFVLLVFLAPYIIVADSQKAVAAMKLSVVSVRKNLLPLLGLSALLILIGFCVGMLLGGIQAGLTYLVKQESVTKLVVALIGSLANAYLGVIVTASFMSFYLAISGGSRSTAVE